jgi:hypothetical protein
MAPNDVLGNLIFRDTITDMVQYQLPTQGATLTAAVAGPDERFLATSDAAGLVPAVSLSRW